jgi:methylmalonyl-CoA mutase N-terminal domain/subunit
MSQNVFERYLEGERPLDYETLSGIPIDPVYLPGKHLMNEQPGVYPYTRGIHAEMYRKRFWTRRQQSGYGTPADSNERLIYLLKIGQTGLNVDYDVPTKLALDPDHPLAEGDAGMQGTSVATYEDVEGLFAGIPIEKVSSTLICQPPASAFIVATYVRLAEKRGIPIDRLIGTIMNCAFTQLVGPTYLANTAFFPIEFTHRIGLDVMEYCALGMPKWNLVNVNAYNVRETGVNAVQEAAFAMMVASEHIEGLLLRGLVLHRCPSRFFRRNRQTARHAPNLGEDAAAALPCEERSLLLVPYGHSDCGSAADCPAAPEQYCSRGHPDPSRCARRRAIDPYHELGRGLCVANRGIAQTIESDPAGNRLRDQHY